MEFDTAELRKLTADLQQAGGRVGREVAAITRKHGEQMRARASALSPVRTGALQGSWELGGSGDGRSGGISATVRSTVRQAFFQEYGTSKMAAQPSAGPALEATAPAYMADMERVGEKLLD